MPLTCLRLTLGLLLSLSQAGCVSHMLAKMAVKAPNRQEVPEPVRDTAFAARLDALYSQKFDVPVGPPQAKLAVAVIEPAPYELTIKITHRDRGGGYKSYGSDVEWSLPEPKPATAPAPRGTVLLLHGYHDTRENMLQWGIGLAMHGFRTVLVDFRGHGHSTGDFIGFGAFEAGDLEQVIDDLQRRGLANGKVGVLGVSYGASMGLLLAARDPRVATVVALEPFSEGRKALVEFARGVQPQLAAKISDRTFEAGLTRAATMGGFSWTAADVAGAMDRIDAPVLLFHGEKDTWIAPEHSRRLAARARNPASRLVILPEDDHLTLSWRFAPIHEEIIPWLEMHMRRHQD